MARAASSDYASAHAGRTTPESVKEWVAARLPEYMVPATVVVLDAMPLGAERQGRPRGAAGSDRSRPCASRASSRRARRPKKRSPRIWMEVLKKDAISVTDDFIALGGHSLLAIRVLGKLSRKFGVRLPLRALFDAPTVEQLAEVVDIEQQLAALAALTQTDA